MTRSGYPEGRAKRISNPTGVHRFGPTRRRHNPLRVEDSTTRRRQLEPPRLSPPRGGPGVLDILVMGR